VRDTESSRLRNLEKKFRLENLSPTIAE
jgi:hypothetical protein